MRLRVKDYRSIATLDETLEGGSAIARGGNGKGKTTVLRAIRAALAGNDIAADAIRKGATSAEILIDLDDVTVRRAITEKGSSLTVSRADGMKASKPQNYLNEILGTTPIDPIDLITMKPRERRAHILEALPCEVTRDQLVAWAPELPDGFNVEGHGLDVLERAHKHFYDVRTAANARAKESRRQADEASAKLGGELEAPEATDLLSLRDKVEAAKREEQRLTVRRDEAVAHQRRGESTRVRIAELRENASTSENTARSIEVTFDELTQARERMEMLRKAIADHEWVLSSLEQQWSRKAMLEKDTIASTKQADELEATLNASSPAPTDEEFAAATGLVAAAETELRRSLESEAIRAAFLEASKLRDTAEADSKRAKQLDAIVVTLREEAPRALLATNEAIPGLTLEGDDVMLDGVRLDALCGAEQMRLAIEIARRANAKGRGRMLIVDGLERLDPDQLELFLAEATRDGWQLIGTRVDRGDIVIEHLEADAGRSEAAE